MTSVRRSVRSAAALAPTWTLITLGVLVPLAALILALSLPPLAADVERLRTLWRLRRQGAASDPP